MTSETYDSKKLKASLKHDAKALGIPTGFADDFITKIITAVDKSLQNKTIVTDKDIDRVIIKESSKYSRDLAFIYQNKHNII